MLHTYLCIYVRACVHIHIYKHNVYVYVYVCVYMCVCVSVYVYVDAPISYLILVIYLYFWLLAWVVSCSSVSVVDFEQVNAGWVLVILMARFLLTNDFFN